MKEDIIKSHKKLWIYFLKIRTISAQIGNHMNSRFLLFYAFKTDDTCPTDEIFSGAGWTEG